MTMNQERRLAMAPAVFRSAWSLMRQSTPFPWQSRVHPLPGMGEMPLFLKRDDELGGLLGGGKWRKWASVIPQAQAAGVSDVVMIGSARSAFVLSGMSLGKAAGFTMHAFLLQSSSPPQAGLDAYRRLLCKEVHWVAREQWAQVEAQAQSLVADLTAAGRRVLFLPEGGWHPYAWAGGLSLAWDMARHLREEAWPEADVWVDAGSGFSAALLIAGVQALALPLRVHVVGMAMEAADFSRRLLALGQDMGLETAALAEGGLWVYHRPRFGRSFGSVPAAAMRVVHEVADRFGVLLDPLYGAKAWPLFWEDETATRPRVFVHSGGGLSLAGLGLAHEG